MGQARMPDRPPSRSIAEVKRQEDIEMMAREMLMLGAMLADVKLRAQIQPQAFYTPLCRQMAEEMTKGPKEADRRRMAETLKSIGVQWDFKSKPLDAVRERQERAAMYRRALDAEREKLKQVFGRGKLEDEAAAIRQIARGLSADELAKFEIKPEGDKP
jgi:hypothetical protein